MKTAKHIPMTLRKWRIRKRWEAKVVIGAIAELRYGCVYTPVYQDIQKLEKLAKAVYEKLRGNWKPGKK